MTPEQRSNFARLLSPRHIAFIGGRDAEVAIGEAKRIGYRGRIWPVNPRRETLGGEACFASLDELPEVPDAAFVAVPVGPAIEVIDTLRRRGAGGIVCYTAGFGEAGPEGRAAQEALVEAAGDMALIGPNCYGVINYLDDVALWPFAQGGRSPGYGCAIITQSGMLSSDLTMSDRSVPLSHMISIGNQAVLTMEDVIDVLCEDDRVRAIGLHIEGLRDIDKFASAAVKAAGLGKPIVALKTGSSQVGKALTSSHTGSLSGEDDLYDALFDRVGIVRVYSPAHLLETLKFLSIAGAPKGNRIAGFTCSGGGATMLADHAEEIGLDFPAHPPQIAERLTGLLPPIATVSNPLDYTTPIWGQPDVTRPVFESAIGAGVDAAVLVQDYPAAGLDESKPFYLADGDAFADAVLAAGVPGAICSTLPENLDRASRDHFIGRGIAPMQGLLETLDAMKAAARWAAIRDRIARDVPGALTIRPVPERRRPIDESAAKARLAAAAVPVPRSQTCGGADAPRAASSIGFPVVVKMVHRDLLHKTDAGAVRLGLGSEAEVADAVAHMRTAVSARQPDALSDIFLVEEMCPKPIAELIVSVRRDPQFGLALTIGSGGILVELLKDAVSLLLPASRRELLGALERLKLSPLLDGYRGGGAANREAVVDGLLAIAGLMEKDDGRIAEIEINPLFVHEDGLCAVDALIHMADGP